MHVRDIRVYIDRSKFMLNPTSCARMTFSAILSGSGASFASSADDVPVTVSAALPGGRLPGAEVQTVLQGLYVGEDLAQERGESLSVKLAYPKDALGTQANIRSVKVNLPKQLPPG